MHILIIGNMGYIGPIVARHFRSVFPECVISGFDRGYFAGCLINPQDFPEITLNHQHFGDVRKFPVEVLNGVDVVIQLAAISNDPMGKEFESVTQDINCNCAFQIAAFAKSAGVKNFVFTSSCSVYGEGGDVAKDELSSVHPLTAYAKSKISAELELEKQAAENFQITCLRFATACGWSPRLRLDLVLNDFVASAICSKRIIILSDGTPWRPLIHVKDMARAIEWASFRERSNGENFLVLNVGSDSWNFQVKEIAEVVGEHIPGVEITVNQNSAPDRRSYRVNFSKFLGMAPKHQPKMSLAESAIELAENLKRIQFNDAEFRKSNLIRLKVLTDLRNSNVVNKDLFYI